VAHCGDSAAQVRSAVKETFAICNANRHVGLALLLAGQYLNGRYALPTVACYALLALLIIFAFGKCLPARAVIVANEIGK
jgi:hypothetical protein